jgi:hypothetical protein
MDFNHFLNKITANPDSIILTIKDQKKHIRGMAKFRSINMGDEEYIKISFADKSGLIILLSGSLFLSDAPIGQAKNIKDSDIGRKPAVIFQGKQYILDNKDDYQFCTRLFVGTPNQDIEGECRFSDYTSKDGTEILSLGWISYDNTRADVLAKQIDISDINFN